MTMVRKQVYITIEQNEMLKRLAASLNVTEAEVIRRGIERIEARNLWRIAEPHATYAGTPEEQKSLSYELPWSRADLYQGHSRSLDDAAWEEELAFIEERARSMPEGGSTVKWHREDAYDSKRSGLSG